MTDPTTDWRIVTLPDGRVVEFVDAQWAPSEDGDPDATVRIAVTVLLDGAVLTQTIRWTADQLEDAYRKAGNRD